MRGRTWVFYPLTTGLGSRKLVVGIVVYENFWVRTVINSNWTKVGLFGHHKVLLNDIVGELTGTTEVGTERMEYNVSLNRKIFDVWTSTMRRKINNKKTREGHTI